MTGTPQAEAPLEVPIRISAKADYAIRAAVELAASAQDGLVKTERVAVAQGMPLGPTRTGYVGAARPLRQVWIAVQASVESILISEPR